MSKTKSIGPITVRMIVLGRDEWQPRDNQGWQEATKDLQKHTPRIRRLAERELAFAVGALLEFELGETLTAAWRTYQTLLSAAVATAAKPGSTELVNLVTHTITSSHKPHIDVEVGGTKVAVVEFDVEITAEIDGLSATVRGGRLTAIHSGQCQVSITLACGGAEVEVGKTTLDAKLTVDLGEGLDLLPPQPLSTVDQRRY